ncbi:amidohydrolase family protein [Sphingomonas suaedae]|uniref:Amidohydrolase family protein n=1 Tax=Sphingomonas suaedae TaxID=2599297 RepID=A0A518RG70_9SPHN|nr:amidohydrolase family protein [Sphingomonas suaedae]QDX26450.1 amidohydrolase family protein [Sphingomonas suaedae]
MIPPLVDRRAVLATGAALPLLASCGPAALGKKPSARRAYADTHVHLFNAHDLPIGMFMVEILFGQGDAPPFLKAIVDYLLRGVQKFADSATAERRRIEGGAALAKSVGTLSPETFGADIAYWATRDPGAEKDANAELPLFANEGERDAAYAELIEAVVADSRGTSLDKVRKRMGEGPGAPVAKAEIQRAFADLARRAENSDLPPPGTKLFDGGASIKKSGGVRCDSGCSDTGFSRSIGAIIRYFGWGYLMLKSREHHLTKYLALAAGQREQPTLILNHLVDYDAWLGVPPRRGSAHVEQVAVAHALAGKYRTGGRRRPGVEIVTFAGFCPLKHALEAKAGLPRALDAMLALGRDKVAGFKLYPPMGFRPSGNKELRNDAFDPRSRYRAAHFRRWRAALAGQGGGKEIGSAIDAALEEFYTTCAKQGIPVMAHAGPGMQAGPDFGQRANPHFWIDVAERHRLRISLGHLVNSAEDFVCALRAGGDPPKCVWALHAGRTLLDPTNSALKATVYGDLAFMPELIESPALAVEFFKGLHAVFGVKDPALTRITYGSDYIMLGTMKDYDEHLSVMRAAMAKAEYTSEQVENILVNNARRFLSG